MAYCIGFVVLIVIFWALLKGGQPKHQGSAKATEKSDADISSNISPKHSNDTHLTYSGQLVASQDGGWVINPGSTFPLTIYNIDQRTAKDFKAILDEESSLGRRDYSHRLTSIIAFSNLRCKEVDDYINKFKPQYLFELEKAKQASKEWQSASEQDQKDLLQEFQSDALCKIDVMPDVDDLVMLFEHDPKDETIDDSLVKRYGYDCLCLYLRFARDLYKARIIPANHPQRKGFEELVNVGLARRGTDIEIKAVIETLKLKEMRELVPDLNPSGFGRKASAIEFLLSLPDIKERLGKKVAFREIFQLRPLPEEFSYINLSKVAESFSYASEIASLISHTYIGAIFATRDWETSQQSLPHLLPNIKGWEIDFIDDDRCCPFCRRAGKKLYPKDQPPKAPLHIGCRCSVSPIFIDE